MDGRMETPVLLVGVGHTDANGGLMEVATHIARHEGYEVVAVHVVDVPPQANLGSVRGSPEMIEARERLLVAIRQAAGGDVAVKGVVEVAREVDEGLVSAAESQNASLILLGYSEPDDEEEEGEAERRFDRVMHKVARTAEADLVVAKLRHEEVGSILLPIDRGTNLAVSGMLARSLSRAYKAPVTILHLLREDEDEAAIRDQLKARLAEEGLEDLGELVVEMADEQVPLLDRMLELANRHDVSILGAQPRPSIAESIFGSWPNRIAREADCTVLVVRAKSTLES